MDLFCVVALPIEVFVGEVLALPFRALLFQIRYFYHYDSITPKKISEHAAEWGPAKVFPIEPRTCSPLTPGVTFSGPGSC